MGDDMNRLIVLRHPSAFLGTPGEIV